MAESRPPGLSSRVGRGLMPSRYIWRGRFSNASSTPTLPSGVVKRPRCHSSAVTSENKHLKSSHRRVDEMSMSRRWKLILRWAVGGGVFGFMFPVVALLTAMDGVGLAAIQRAHSSQPVLWIVNLAPIVLAGAGVVGGIQHARVDAALMSTDQKVRDRTAELSGAYLKLENLMASKDQFVAMVSHEVRNPLTVVMGFAEELRSNAFSFSPSEVAELAGVIAEQSLEISNIIEDILVAARSDMSSLSIVLEDTTLEEQADLVLRGYVGVAEVRDAIVVEASTTIAVADPARVRQILRNLLSNAVRYGGDRISIKVEARSGQAVISVQDDGAGIPKDHQETVFEAYAQAEQTRKVSGSVGLGLHVARTLARAMHGDLSYRYENSTSIFELALPLSAHATADSVRAQPATL